MLYTNVFNYIYDLKCFSFINLFSWTIFCLFIF